VDLSECRAAVAAAPAVVAVGARTQFEVGNRVEPALEVRAPAGVVDYEPADMTITVGGGTRFRALDDELRAHGQECALDPRAPDATVGGLLAAGLSGVRRLRHGPIRDHVLEVHVVMADGRVVKGGGPTVKNVTGYDLPRLLVGSLGTLAVLARVTLRCRPRAPCARWFTTTEVPRDLYRPSSVLWDGRTAHVLLEGVRADVDAEAHGMAPATTPELPVGPHRGRISVAPGHVRALTGDLDGLRWCAELGVGTVHVACEAPTELQRARRAAERHGGWLLREAGGDGIDGFGSALPNRALMRRIKHAFDPTGKLAPGRLPL
jgi:glycolate oxidase FAD binding subunit